MLGAPAESLGMTRTIPDQQRKAVGGLQKRLRITGVNSGSVVTVGVDMDRTGSGRHRLHHKLHSAHLASGT
jgi:hypothetical protein